jgi:hypothetical membrane protein
MATTTSKGDTGRGINGVLATPEIGRWLALGAVVGPVLFTLAWIVLGLLQPAMRTEYGVMGGVSGAISNPISGLGVGPNAQLFNAAFILSGLMLLAGVVGIFQTTRASGQAAARRACAALLALSPLGLAMAGIFTLESSLLLHNVAALLLFAPPVLGFLAAGLYFRHIPRWRRFGNWLLVGSPLTLLLMFLFVRTFDLATVAAGLGVAGLTERVLLVEIHAWFVAMGWLAFRRS